MLDREVVKGFLKTEFVERDFEIPGDIPEDAMVETFCQYAEDDYYEWLKDNFKSFFNHGDPNWGWVRRRLVKNEQY